MSKYIFIESKDPFDSKDTIQTYGLIKELSAQGHQISFYLVQNAVFASRKNAQMNLFQDLTKDANITIFADDLSVEERGIEANDMYSQITISSIDDLVDSITTDDSKIIWH